MNAAGQAILEFLLLMAIFMLLIAGSIRQIPLTFSQATPYLAGKIEQRLETGGGFANPWRAPIKPKGGIHD